MTNTEIVDYIDNIPETTVKTYSEYWDTITPKTHDEYFKRFVFAIFSVHTSWRANLRAYIAYDNATDLTDKQKLQQLIQYSKVGLVTMRTEGLWKFKQDFYKEPALWYKQAAETWDAYRDRTMELTHGLGYAKTAFAIEMCYPNQAEVTCLDTHALQLYNYTGKGSPSKSKYKEMEKHWVNACLSKGYSPFMVRNIYWDNEQRQKDSRYWTACFEPKLEASTVPKAKSVVLEPDQDRLQSTTAAPA